MMNKQRNNYLMQLADRVLNEGQETILDRTTLTIKESYNGQIAALGVTIAMSGIRPAIAIYYQDGNNRAVNRRAILDVIARMMSIDTGFSYPASVGNARELLHAIMNTNEVSLKELKKEVVSCAVALKQVVRTYEHTPVNQ